MKTASKVPIIDRYLLQRYLVPFAYCLVSFLLLILIYDFSINLEDFIDGKVRLDIVLEYFVYSIPVRMMEIVPMSSLLSLLYSMGQLKKHNEITALQASGVSIPRLMAPYLSFGLVISLAILVMNESLVPHCKQRIAKIESVYMKKGDAADSGAAQKVFAFFNLRESRSWVGVLDPSKKKLLKVEIRDFGPNDKVLRKITAEMAEWSPEGWKFSKGKEENYQGDALSSEQTRNFVEETMALPETMRDIYNSQKDPTMMGLRELKKHIKIHPKHSRIYHEEKVEYYHKWAYPFLNLLVIFMGVPVALKMERGGFFMGIGTSIGLFFGYYALNLISLTLGKNETLPAWFAAWLPSIVFLAVGINLLRKSK